MIRIKVVISWKLLKCISDVIDTVSISGLIQRLKSLGIVDNLHKYTVQRGVSYKIALGNALDIFHNSEENFSLMVTTGCPSHFLNFSFSTNVH